jgi:DNA-binding beta-propeller fold protein YncE
MAYISSIGTDGHTPGVTIVDMDRMSIIDSYPFHAMSGIQQGHFISVSPDGKYIWIAENISNTDGYMQVLDAATGQQVKSWNVGAGVGNHMTRDVVAKGRDGSGSTRTPNEHHYVFASSQQTNNINVFDVEDQTYLGAIPVGAAPHVIDTSPDGKWLWTTNAAGGQALKYDISGLPYTLPTAPSAVVNIGGSLHALLVHPNGKYVFVGSSTAGNAVNVIDTSTNTVVATGVGGVSNGHNYEISPDHKYLLVGNLANSHLDFINISTLDTANPDMTALTLEKWFDATLLGAPSISHQNYDPSGKHIMVTTYRAAPLSQGEFLVLNADTLVLEKEMALAENPHGIAYPGDNR